MLKVNNLAAHYGIIQALKGVSLEVRPGEIVAIIGANGAGKTTLLRSIIGLHKPSGGKVSFLGKRIDHLKTETIVPRGLTLVPEGRRLFPQLSVMDNLVLGSYTRSGPEVKKDFDYVFSMFPRLRERRKQTAGTLSGGEQQMVALGRALMAAPKMLLLDEPSMGLAPILVKQIFDTIGEINKKGTTILLVEQNARMALKLAHRAYVIETGRIVLSGQASDLTASEEVNKAYLGEQRRSAF